MLTQKHIPFITAIVILAILFVTTPAQADVVKVVRTEYYAVQGKSPREIYSYLKTHSPLNKGNKTYQAHTRTKIKTQYKMFKRGNVCTVKDVVVYLDLTYLYPKLVHSVDRKTRTWWKDFIAKLEEHELIHGQISIKAAHAIDDYLKSIKSGDCTYFRESVKGQTTLIMEKMKNDQIAYDNLTEHGLKQERNRGRYP